MTKPRIIQVGAVRTDVEAVEHAKSERCPVCGGPLAPGLSEDATAPYAYRQNMRCTSCPRGLIFDYLPAPGWDPKKLRGGLAQAVEENPTLLFDAAFLERKYRAHEEALGRLAPQTAPPVEVDGSLAVSIRTQAREALRLLLELGKLPDAPAELRPPASASGERALAERLRSLGPLTPEAKRAVDFAGTPREPAFTPARWALTFFVDRAAFEATPLPGMPAPVVEDLRFTVAAVLDLVQKGLDAAVGRAAAWSRIDRPPPRPIAFVFGLGIGDALGSLFQTGAQSHLDATWFELRGYRLATSFFDAISTYQATLQRAADLVSALKEEGATPLILQSPTTWKSHLEQVISADEEFPSWPLDEGTLSLAENIDASVQALLELRRKVEGSAGSDRPAAWAKALAGRG